MFPVGCSEDGLFSAGELLAAGGEGALGTGSWDSVIFSSERRYLCDQLNGKNLSPVCIGVCAAEAKEI